MDQYIKPKMIPILLSLMIVLLSCGDEKVDDSLSASVATTNNIASTDAVPTTAAAATPALVGNLYRLYIKRSDFVVPNGRRLILAHTFRDPNVLTLYGWPCKNKDCTNGDFDPLTPAVKFERGIATGGTYGPNVIFSNVYIDKEKIKTIKEFKDPNGNYYTYIVFVPEKDGEYLKYNIHVSNDPASLVESIPKALVDTNIDANPSPPRN
jgi:hypothetical protein